MTVFVKGLIATGLGLAGVFLVLALFFVAIKLLQKVAPEGKGEAQDG